MKLTEFEGKKLFRKYGIGTPKGVLVKKTGKTGSDPAIALPAMVKAQVRSGDRKKAGGIFFANDKRSLAKGIKELLGSRVNGEAVKEVLVEEYVPAAKEYCISINYDTDARGPVLSLSPNGGSGIARAKNFPIDILLGVPQFFLRQALKEASFPTCNVGILLTIQKLWELFIKEYALLAEINPLFKTKEGTFIAGDAKIILDDEKLEPAKHHFIEMAGDIAILASGGGASLLNIDALIRHGGKPANYTEYSGNPKGEVVRELTKRVLGKKGLKGAWVVGGTANFTDIYETMKGFVEGLREVKPKPTYPIVIRRDGPRQKEAFEMLREVGKKEGYQFHLFGSETAMAETAGIIVKLAYGKQRNPNNKIQNPNQTQNPKPKTF